jgi:hypothetical protein
MAIYDGPYMVIIANKSRNAVRHRQKASVQLVTKQNADRHGYNGLTRILLLFIRENPPNLRYPRPIVKVRECLRQKFAMWLVKLHRESERAAL